MQENPFVNSKKSLKFRKELPNLLTNLIDFCRTIPQGTEQCLESRSMTFHVSVDLGLKSNGEIDSSAPECEVDETIMLKSPILFHVENNNKKTAVRKLFFHEDEEISDVSRMYQLISKIMSEDKEFNDLLLTVLIKTENLAVQV